VFCEVVRGRWAVLAAVLALAFTCAPPRNVASVNSPIPAPSPTPTVPLQASSAPFHGGEVGVAYAPVALTASGGVAPYTWTVSAGALPGGLTVGGDGSVSGTPTSAGTFTFTIQAADSGDSLAKVDGSIGIAAALAVSLIPACAQYCRVELGCVGVCGQFGQLSGGVGPYQYSVAQGPLPAGTTLSELSLKGTFKGLSGYLKFTVQVTDAMGGSTTIAPTFWMYDHISLAGGTCTGRGGCKVTLAYTGGVPGPQPTLAPTGWAAGSCSFTAFVPCPQPTFTVSYQPGQVTVALSYPNSPATNGTLTVQLTESNPCAAGTRCSSSASIKVG